MVDLSGAISQMVIMLLIACIGFVAGRLHYIDAPTRSKLTKILLNITLPCMIVASVGELDAASAHGQLLWAFILAAVQYALFLVVGLLCNVILRVPKEQRPLYLLMSTCSNNGFIGLPVIAAIYGSQTVLFSSIFIMVIAFFFYSVSFGILASAGEAVRAEQEEKQGDGTNLKSHDGAGHAGTSRHLAKIVHEIPWKSIVNPSMIASIVAIVFLLGGVHIPYVLEETMDMVGSMTSPLAMMIVGALMSSVNLRTVVNEVRIYPFILIRHILVPVVLFFVLSALGFDTMLTAVFVIMFAMPVGSMASTFASEFGLDALLPAKGTVLSTLASFVIIPALVAVMVTF